MRRFATSRLGILLSLLFVQWAWASYHLVHVVKSVSLSDDTIHVEARRAVVWGHFVPVLGAILFLDPYSHNITISGYGQREVVNVDMVIDFPWAELQVHDDAGTVSVVDNGGTAYARFQK